MVDTRRDKIIPKRSSVAGKVPHWSSLEVGEIAINFPDAKIYTRDPFNNIITFSAGGGGFPTAGTGISIVENVISVDSTVVRTTGDFTLDGNITFNGTVSLDLGEASFTGVLPIGNLPEHNNLQGLQGGDANDRFHLTAAQVTKLNGIAAGAQVNVPTNLSYNATTRLLSSSTGDDVTLPQVTTTLDGLMIASDKVKLNSLSNVNLTAGGNVTITGTYPNLTISSTDTNTTYTAGTGITLTGTTFSLADERFTSALLTKLNGIEAGAQVNVPTNLGLSGTGNTRTITSSTGGDVAIPVVTTTNAGFMSTGDKTKLDGIAAGAQVNVPTNLGYTASNRVLTSSTGTNVTLPQVTTSLDGLMIASDKVKLNGLSNVNLTAGTNVTVTGTYPNLTISSTDTNTTYSAGTGITLTGTTFSLSDEQFTSALLTKLNGIESGAQVNVPTNLGYTSSTRTITSSTGSNVVLPMVTTSSDGLMIASDKAKLNGLSNVNLTGGTNVTISGTYPNLTISSTDTNTTYTAGTGITLTGTTFSLSDEKFTSALLTKLNGIEAGAQVNVPTNLGYTSSTRTITSSTGSNVALPQVTTSTDGLMIAGDKVKLNSLSNVNLTGGANVTVSGTYPNLTISSTDTTYSAGTGITLTGTTFSLSDERFTSALLSKLNGIAAGAQVNVPTNLSYNTSTRTLSSSTGTGVIIPQVTTTLDGLMIASDKVKLNGLSNVNLTAGTNVTVTGTYPNLTISSTDTNTTYSAGIGITLTGTTFSLSDEKFTSALLSKLNGIETGAQVNVATNLGMGGAGNSKTITSSTGTGVSIPVATTTSAGFMSTGDKTKLDGIATGAQVNVPTNLGYIASARTITSSTGSNVVLPMVTTSSDGLMIASDKTKLDGIAAGAQVNVPTNLGYTASTRVLTSSTGTNVTLPQVTTSNAGLMSASDKTKLNGIAAGATANSTDAQLRDRATHTGTQAISTVSGLQTALDGKLASTANAVSASRLNRVAVTASTGSDGSGKFSKVATITISSRYQDYNADWKIIGYASGSTLYHDAGVNVRVKQQSAFGENPFVQVSQYNENSNTPYEVFYHIVQNTAPTTVDIYIKVNASYTAVDVFEVARSGAGGTCQYFSFSALVDTVAGSVMGDINRRYHDGYHPNADTLTTARAINGTNFNGSGNITTARWGTARNISIGSSTKSVNGSASVSYTLAEIGAAATSHDHTISNVTGLQTALDGKEPAFSKNTAFNKNFGNTAGTVTQGNDARLSNSREWTASTVTQAEAEAGTATTRRAWTAQRVMQAIAAWWNASAMKTKLDGIQAGAQVNTVTSVAGKTGAVTLVKGDVGLGNVNNTSDLNKPISTATQTALTNGFNNLNASNLTTGTVPNARLTASTTSVAGIVQLNNTLTSTSTTQALTANQGKILKDAVDQLVEGSDWVNITTSVNVTLANNQRVRVDVDGLNITLPSSPSTGNRVAIAVGDFKNTTIVRNGSTILGKADNARINIAHSTVSLYYDGNTWRFN